jgi:hypothetical protein
MPSAQTLVNDALAALKSARSVRLSGGSVQNGKHLPLDVGFMKSGALSGTLSGSFGGLHGTFKLILVGGHGYILVDKQFFDALTKGHSMPVGACAALCGKYIETPVSQFAGFDLISLTSPMFGGQHHVVSGVTVTSINGQPAYRVSNGHGTYLYVAKNGTHYPLEIAEPGSGTLMFTQWNSVPPITAPPTSQIAKLPGGI